MFAHRPLTAIVDAYEIGTANVSEGLDSEGTVFCIEANRSSKHLVEGTT